MTISIAQSPLARSRRSAGLSAAVKPEREL